MTKERIVSKLKNYVYHELDVVKRYSHDPDLMRINDPQESLTKCYHIVMFVVNLDGFDEDLVAWWGDEILPAFKNLIKESKKR